MAVRVPRLFICISLFWNWLIEFLNIALMGFFVAINVFEEYSNVCFILLFSSDLEPVMFMMLRTGLLLKAPIDNLRAVL